MKHHILILLITSFTMFSCEKEDKIYLPPDTEQTVLMYMPWSSDLTFDFYNNISDLEKALEKNILKNERVLVFFSTSPTEATLFEITYKKGKCIRNTLKQYLNPAFTTAQGITSILNDVKNFAPANRYAMAIGCHGKGWIPVSTSRSRNTEAEKMHWEYEGVPRTRFFGGKESKYQTDITTLSEGIINAGIKMEYILFDDCYMSSIEVAYDLKDATDHLIASTSEIMAYGMPYAEIGKYMIGNVDYKGICDAFYSFYKNYSVMPCGTIAVTVCSELEPLAAIMKEINDKYTFDYSLLNSLQKLDGYSPVIFFDYGDYVSNLCADKDLLKNFNHQLERTVPSDYMKYTDYFYTMSKGKIKIETFSGITISDPSIHPDASSKEKTAWYEATH